MPRIFGEFENFPVGSSWKTRMEVSAAGVHKPPMNGISGKSSEGCDSIVVSGGYADDIDLGDELIYTGTGGFDLASKQQVADQTFDHTNNAALVTSQLRGLPVRVIRGSGGDPKFSPKSGYRYDGLYSVVDHWSEVGKSGFRICRFRLLSIKDLNVIKAPTFSTEQVPVGELNPSRVAYQVTRLVRSTRVSEFVKELYGFKCQICGINLDVPNGKIAEGAHIKPLGRPHNGPDVVENVLCLCPNHHSSFDLGGIYILDDFSVFDFRGNQIGKVFRNPKHIIDVSFIQYHRSLLGKNDFD